MGRLNVKYTGDSGEGVVLKPKWFMIIYMSVVHLLAIWGAVRLFVAPKLSTVVLFFATYWLAGLGITAGAHRLWSHRAYKAHDIVRFFLMLCNSLANQGSIYHWSRDHRVHHRHSETEADPHNAARGFFFAHCGWLFLDKHRSVIEAGRQVGMSDLEADWTVMFQDRNKHWMMPLFCFVLPATVATLLGDTYWNGLLIVGALRYVSVLHGTWMVNSVAHWYGMRPYKQINPSENWLVTFFSGGEGWHNWHHVYPSDYSASELGILDQFNPTTAFIDAMAFLGLVWDRKKSKWNPNKKTDAKEEKDENDHVHGQDQKFVHCDK